MKLLGDRKDTNCLAQAGGSGTETGGREEQQTSKVTNETCALATELMERVCDRSNLNQAYQRVKSNKGAPGIDGMTVGELGNWIRDHREQLVQSLLDGRYEPQDIKGVKIPKSCGGERQLGIPTVVDRMVQQAIHQVLEPIFDPEFSESSYGFRPGRSAHMALNQASRFVREGHVWVVDMDLEKFFDRVNHDILMSRLARRIGDKRLLKIVRRFLEAGLMQDGVCIRRTDGTPQGGPLSPLLSNILLDELDKELEKRGHKFCRYADDQNIYVRSERAGQRVFESIKRFLENKLKLKVNDEKSKVALVRERKFLGYRIQLDGCLTLAPETEQRVKDKVRRIASRSRGVSFEVVIGELNQYLRGWLGYYRLCRNKRLWEALDGWIRRKLRCYRLKQRKRRGDSIAQLLMNLGVSAIKARQLGSSGKGWWRLSQTPATCCAMSNAWFSDQGLMSLKAQWELMLLQT